LLRVSPIWRETSITTSMGIPSKIMPDKNPVFLDTSGWIALLNHDDEYHAAALELLREFQKTRRYLVTTDWVLAETGNGLARTPAKIPFLKSITSLFHSSQSRLIWIQEEILEAAAELYGKTDDKQWGLVDCASFVVMQHEEIQEALSADHHFEQAGFRCMLLS
jgi:uncharacterized protein